MDSIQTKLQQYTNNSNNSDLIQFRNNKELDKFSKLTKIKAYIQGSNLNKSYQIPSKDIKFNKLNINSSLNPPSLNTDKNNSLNEQFLQPKKELIETLNNDDLQKGEDENVSIFNEYIIIKNKKNQIIDKIKNINIRIKINKLKVEEIKKKLANLKEDKKQKQAEIVNLLSNKESIEEIYINQIHLLTNHLCSNANNNNTFNENNILNNDINNLTNISIKNDMNDNSTINLNIMHNITIADNEILNNDEDNFKISLSEVKESDQNIYNKQVKNMFEEIFKIKDDKINSSIQNIINNSYELYINKIIDENENENNEMVVENFFTKISLFIFNHSLGKYSESKINLILKYLMKINSINVKLTKYIKFVNKKYKEEKNNLNGLINFLEKKNINLINKKHRLENNKKEYEERLEFFGKNDIFETEPNYEGDDTLELKDIKNKKSNDENHIINPKILDHPEIINSQNLKNINILYSFFYYLFNHLFINFFIVINLRFDNIIKYDSLSNELSYQRLKKIKRIKNKKSNNICSLNTHENIRRKNENLEKNNNDELDNDIMTYYDEAIAQNKENNYKENDLSYKYIQKISTINRQKNNKKQNFLNNTKRSDSNLTIERNSKNKIKIMNANTFNQSSNLRNKTNNGFQIGPKIIGKNFNNTSTNIINYNRIFPSNQNLVNDDEKELEIKMSSLEFEHYNRVQRIMNASPNVSNFFGVNNYNPKNHTYKPITPSIPSSNNKIDKTIRYGSRKNHNFISIINMTKTIPDKNDNEIEKIKSKEKSIRKNKEIGNDSSIKIINLKENFLNEITIKNETENKNNESSSITKSNKFESNTNNKFNNDNNKSNNLIINDSIENEDNIKIFNKINDNSNKIHKEQRYFIKIENSKEIDKEKNSKNIKVISDKDENKKYINNKKENINLFNNNNYIKTLKITKSRELNINDIKNNKLSLITKKNLPKILFIKKDDKPKEKINNTNNKDNQKALLLNSNQLRAKPYISSNKTKICTKKISSNFTSQKMSENNSFMNINDKSLNRSISLIEYQPKENNQKYNIKKVNTNINKYHNKTININKSKNNIINRNYNSNTYERNIKNGFKSK